MPAFRILSFLRDDSGATAIEYGLISALMAVAAIAAFTAMGGGLNSLFGSSEAGVGQVVDNALDNLGP